jgi:bis(5'-nucleosyl)-tetraphosphatase (symmetrical)
MATYAVGDVQGCYDSLRRLVDVIGFEPAKDQLWFVGDLVNRGPRSLEVLRWVRGLGDRAVVVLGNHDLHLLGRAAGTSKQKRLDTVRAVLDSPDRDELVDWLRCRPFVHAERGQVLVHAGLHPDWSVSTAMRLSGELQARLSGPDWKAFLQELGGGPVAWRPDLAGAERTRSLLSYFVRVRTCTNSGYLPIEFDGPPEEAPPGCTPWYALPGRAWADHTAIFGHWAALGLRRGRDWIALDSGCVWGKKLSAVRLEDRAVYQVHAVEVPIAA